MTAHVRIWACTDFEGSALAEVASKKLHLLSEAYLTAVRERIGKALVESQQPGNVERLAFDQEGSPSTIELVQAALTVYCLGCRGREQLKDVDPWIQRFQSKVKA